MLKFIFWVASSVREGLSYTCSCCILNRTKVFSIIHVLYSSITFMEVDVLIVALWNSLPVKIQKL